MPHSFNIDTFLSGHVFAFLILLSRIGAVMMLFPGIGERYVPARTRLIFACLVSLLLLEPMFPRLPALPSSPAVMVQLVSYEVIIGLFFGTLVRIVISALDAAGLVIGVQTGLSNATVLNPALATQSPLSSAFLSIIGLTLIFVSGADHFLLRTTFALYDAFPAGGELMPEDMAQTIIRVTNQSFTVGIELAAPFLIMGLLLYSAVGILQRLLPTIQLFLVTLPLEIWGGLAMLSLTVAGMMTIWMRYFDQSVGTFFQG